MELMLPIAIHVKKHLKHLSLFTSEENKDQYLSKK